MLALPEMARFEERGESHLGKRAEVEAVLVERADNKSRIICAKENLLADKMPAGGFCYALAYHLNPGIAQEEIDWSTVVIGIVGCAIIFLPTDVILFT